VNLLRDNIDTIKKKTETVIDASKEDGLEINAKRKYSYVLFSHYQNASQNPDIKIENKLFQNVAN
jgi:hypothetical protein